MGGAVSAFASEVFITNSILRADSAFGYPNELFGSALYVSYSNIQSGWQGEGNIDVNPRFRDIANDDYHLMTPDCGDNMVSSCIDAGDPSIFDDILDCDWGLGTERSDMGAYGGGANATIIRENDGIDFPAGLGLSQNYPNPFNSSTTISYSLAEPSYINISIYNVLGELEEILFEGDRPAGQHRITWNAVDYPSGIYFSRIKAGEQTGSIRILLLK